MNLGARLRGRTATQRSQKGSGEGFWGRVLRRGPAMGCTVRRVLRRVLRGGSGKGVCRRFLEIGVAPVNVESRSHLPGNGSEPKKLCKSGQGEGADRFGGHRADVLCECLAPGQPLGVTESGGALKERRNGRAGKRSSKHLKMDNNKLSTKNPQLDSPEKIHIFWIKATCDSRFCVLDASEQKTNSSELTDGLPRHGPSDWDKVTKHERSVFRFSHIYF